MTVSSEVSIYRGGTQWDSLWELQWALENRGTPILGMVAAGEIESIGSDVKRFKIDDPVLAYTVLSPFKTRLGTYAEYICIPEDWIVLPKPPNITFEEAAAIPYPGELAMFFLKKGDIQRRKNVLIVGASGSIGTTAVQIARHYGAKVTGVCSNANLELVRSLGVEMVIDYTKEDYSLRGERYDLILDAVPQQLADRKSLKLQAKNSLTKDGKYISIADGIAKVSYDNLALLLDLTKSGEFKPVIDRSYPLEQMVEAHRYVEAGHKKGNVVIII